MVYMQCVTVMDICDGCRCMCCNGMVGGGGLLICVDIYIYVVVGLLVRYSNNTSSKTYDVVKYHQHPSTPII